MSIQQKIRIKIPKGYSPEVRQQIADSIILFIQDRTKIDSMDKDDSKFPKYSKEYAKEQRKRKVNLTKSGDMMANIKLLDSRAGYLTIGYEKGYEGMGKVEGNRKGTYGQMSPIPGKSRDFLGLVEEDLLEILDLYPQSSDDIAQGVFEQNIEDNARQLSRAQIERLEREKFLRDLGISNV